MRYHHKSAGSWKISHAIPTTPTRGCGHSTTRTRLETRRRRHVDLLPNPSISLITIFSHKTMSNSVALSKIPGTLHASASSSVSPSPFAASSRASTSNPREETAHTAAINTADKGNHTSLSREDAPPGENASGDIEMRGVSPDHDRDQGPVEVCTITPTSPARIHTPCNRTSILPRTPPPTASFTRTQYRCSRLNAPFSVYAYAM
jgi:hypothetical protein